jgi:hypothetical protein
MGVECQEETHGLSSDNRLEVSNSGDKGVLNTQAIQLRSQKLAAYYYGAGCQLRDSPAVELNHRGHVSQRSLHRGIGDRGKPTRYQIKSSGPS